MSFPESIGGHVKSEVTHGKPYVLPYCICALHDICLSISLFTCQLGAGGGGLTLKVKALQGRVLPQRLRHGLGSLISDPIDCPDKNAHAHTHTHMQPIAVRHFPSHPSRKDVCLTVCLSVCLSASPRLYLPQQNPLTDQAALTAWKLSCAPHRKPLDHTGTPAMLYSLSAGGERGRGHSRLRSRRCREEFHLSAPARALAPLSVIPFSVTTNPYTHTPEHFQHPSQPIGQRVPALSHSRP